MDKMNTNAHTHKQKAIHVMAKDTYAANALSTEHQSLVDNQLSADEYENGAAGLSTILGQIVAYFSGRAHVDDLDVLSFSLHHLFCHLDYLYHTVLPTLLATSTAKPQTPAAELLQRQHLWSQLRTIKHSLNRMEPLCNLLSDAISCILDALDGTDVPATAHTSVEGQADDGQDWLQALDEERWEQALAALTGSLSSWQHQHNRLTSFVQHFASLVSTMPAMPQLDEAFNVLLDCAAAIFGDILPSFQAISPGDDEAVATLLFDLMQQSDQLLVQFDKALDPLHNLIEHFSLLAHHET